MLGQFRRSLVGEEAGEEELDDFEDGEGCDDHSNHWHQIEGYVQHLHLISLYVYKANYSNIA